jgi:NADPH-dependent 2,4-dienoyl-CoA reductase/sulfur reductase-like enzyme
LIARTAATFRDRLAIDVRLRHRVEALDLENREVQVRDLETGDRRRETYDELMLATGAVPLRPNLPGVDAPGVHGVQTLDDGLAVLAALEDSSVRRAVVVGGGYIGLEMAEAFLRRGLEVSVRTSEDNGHTRACSATSSQVRGLRGVSERDFV